MSKVILTAAVVGAEVMKEQNPAVPYSCAEIAQAAVNAWKAGAAVVHLHARQSNGRASQKAEHFREIIDRIRSAGSDVVIQVSTGGAVGMSVDERMGSLVPGAEMGTLNLGTMNFGADIFENKEADIRRIAQRLMALGLVPECETYDSGHLDTLKRLWSRGELGPNYHVQFVMGVPGGIAATPEDLMQLVDKLHRLFGPTHWSVAAVGRFQLPMAEEAMRLGGHVRVGLEDNLYLSKGVLAKGSDQLIERAVTLAAKAGRTPATSNEARRILGIATRSDA